MSVMWMLSGAAWAGTAVWLSGTPDPTVTPGHGPVPVAEIAAPPSFSSADSAAIRALRDETRDARPLLDEFDGELAIIRRLDPAIRAVTLVRPADVDTLWAALVLQGLAIQRYFPHPATEEAASAGVTVDLGGRAENRAWASSIALLPDRQPTDGDLTDDAARIAYQEQRARALLLQPGEIALSNLPADATVLIDGDAVTGATSAVVPGTHRVSVEVGGAVVSRATLTVAAGERSSAPYLAVAPEIASLEPTLVQARGAVALPPAVSARLEQLDGPVYLVVEGPGGPRTFAVQGGAAVPEDRAPSPQAQDRAAALVVRVAGGWVYDGDYLLLNAADGAAEEPATVNAIAPVVGVAGELPLGPLTTGLGVDLVLPVGATHTLPSGERTVRLRAHPHLSLGAGPVAATVGWWTPWHLAVGARGTLPLTDTWGITAAYVHGLGITRPREAGPAFEPAASRVGWVGAQASF